MNFLKTITIVHAFFLSLNAYADPMSEAIAAYEAKNYTVAIQRYRLAAAQGDTSAQNNLGVMYEKGQGVVQDFAEAVRWYKWAAAQGHSDAQYNLGVMYGNGRGVVQDYVRAHMWLNLAGAKGNENAIKNRAIVAAKMTSQQIAEAQKMARECQARNFKNCE